LDFRIAQEKPVRVDKLANAPGKTLTVVTVNYAPGGKSGKHHNDGSVFAYVLSVRSARKLGDRAGQGLQGRRKLLRTARKSSSGQRAQPEPASMLVIFVADDGAQLTTFNK
jgi:hypothetical protein